MCPARRSAPPAVGRVLPQLGTPQTCLSEIQMVRPFHSIRNLEIAAVLPSFAVAPPHDSFSSAPSGGSDHGEELLSGAWGDDSPARDSAETHREGMFGFSASRRARWWGIDCAAHRETQK